MPKPTRDTGPDDELPADEQDAIRELLPEAPDLGPATRVAGRYGKLSDSPAMAAAAAGLGLVIAAVVGVVVATNPPAEPGERYAAFAAIAVPALVALGAIGYGAFLFVRPPYRRGERWIFFRDGVVRLRWGRRPVVFPWSELQVRKTRANPLSRKYELANGGGEVVTLGVGVIGNRLIRDVQEEHVRAARPGLLQAVANGEAVKFGKLAVTRDGLRYKKDVLPWADVRKLDFKSDPGKNWDVTLAVDSGDGDPWVTLNVGKDLPNAWLFVELIAKLEPRAVPKGKGRENLRGWLI